ncbi:DUF86 domain-containing protein [Microcystis aeruginosa]|uniref:HepT-like ribonuclease domain-containing protein n=1 Tax=Microcystis aeruginosa TaxID=1126 RepID=UPI00187FF721|nr:HepT-like ribonuclease domain-containing protein [Microcystis aeruginosa]MBE8992941.1 DUF86 domain-containing protein [Microcystis aeruginosa LEGE 91341]
MRDDPERLRDILEAIERVEKYARPGKTVFEQRGDASDLRNLTIHEYFCINLEIIWDIVENDIPALKGQIEAILQEFI